MPSPYMVKMENMLASWEVPANVGVADQTHAVSLQW